MVSMLDQVASRLVTKQTLNLHATIVLFLDAGVVGEVDVTLEGWMDKD